MGGVVRGIGRGFKAVGKGALGVAKFGGKLLKKVAPIALGVLGTVLTGGAMAAALPGLLGGGGGLFGGLLGTGASSGGLSSLGSSMFGCGGLGKAGLQLGSSVLQARHQQACAPLDLGEATCAMACGGCCGSYFI